MKKIMYIIVITSFLFLTGCNKNKGYTILDFDQFQTKIYDKDTFVLVMGSSTCSACAKYEQTMKDVINGENVPIFYLDLHELTKDEYSKIYSKYVINSTPTTIFIKDGLETSTYDRIVGTASYSEIVENLEKHGFIGE